MIFKDLAPLTFVGSGSVNLLFCSLYRHFIICINSVHRSVRFRSTKLTDIVALVKIVLCIMRTALFWAIKQRILVRN